jgi:DNA-binding NarL/FixJ family response regulator
MRVDGIHWPDEIKVLIVEVPALLAEVVRRTVDEQSDMRVVATVGSPEELRAALQRPVDVVVTSSRRNELKTYVQALLFSPDPPAIVSLSTDGSCIDVYGRWTAQAVGIGGLTRLIREAAAASAQPRTGE